jgi:hypothetical protein
MPYQPMRRVKPWLTVVPLQLIAILSRTGSRPRARRSRSSPNVALDLAKIRRIVGYRSASWATWRLHAIAASVAGSSHNHDCARVCSSARTVISPAIPAAIACGVIPAPRWALAGRHNSARGTAVVICEVVAFVAFTFAQRGVVATQAPSPTLCHARAVGAGGKSARVVTASGACITKSPTHSASFPRTTAGRIGSGMAIERQQWNESETR